MKESAVKVTSIALPRDLYNPAKRLAQEEGISFKDLVEQALKEYLSREKQK